MIVQPKKSMILEFLEKVFEKLDRDLLFIKGKGLFQLPESISVDATNRKNTFQDTGYSTASRDSQIPHSNRVGQLIKVR